MKRPHNFVFDQFVITDQGGTLCPAIVADRKVTEQYLVSNWTGNFEGNGFLALFRIDGSVSAGSTSFARIGFLKVPRHMGVQVSRRQSAAKRDEREDQYRRRAYALGSAPARQAAGGAHRVRSRVTAEA